MSSTAMFPVISERPPRRDAAKAGHHADKLCQHAAYYYSNGNALSIRRRPLIAVRPFTLAMRVLCPSRAPPSSLAERRSRAPLAHSPNPHADSTTAGLVTLATTTPTPRQHQPLPLPRSDPHMITIYGWSTRVAVGGPTCEAGSGGRGGLADYASQQANKQLGNSRAVAARPSLESGDRSDRRDQFK